MAQGFAVPYQHVLLSLQKILNFQVGEVITVQEKKLQITFCCSAYTPCGN
jgi:hypothetical protein